MQLLGRGRECGTIGRVLASARDDVAAVLVLQGPAGVGKSALLEWAAESVPSMTTVAIHGSEAGQRFRWSVLRGLIVSLEAEQAGLPRWQIDVLTGVLGGGVTDDPVAVGAALMALLSNAAMTRPVLVVIDDAHWLDPASDEALKFVARRIDYDPVVMLFAAESGGSPRFEADPFPVMDVAGLSPIDAITLLADQVETKVAEELARLTDGNPLAMREIAAQLEPAQRSGAAPIGSVPALGDVLLRGFERHADGLSHAQQLLLVIAAAEPGLDRATFAAAATAAGLEASDIETVVRPGLLVVAGDGGFRFPQPLLREAMYRRARPTDRRIAHRALATAFRDTPDEDRRAWHLAAGTDGCDPTAGRELEELAARANDRGDARTAGLAFVRAAELSDRREEQVRRFIAAGHAFSLGDLNEQAVGAFERALELTDDATAEAEIQVAPRGTAPRGVGFAPRVR